MRERWLRVNVGLGIVVSACVEETVPDRRVPDAPAPLDCTGEACEVVTRIATCLPETWCWARGWPLQVSGGSTEDSVHAFGPSGAFLRWQADRWVSQPVPTAFDLVSAAIGPTGDAWSIDAMGTAWRLQAGGWQQAPADAPLYRIAGIVDSTVFAVAGGSAVHGTASGGELLRFDRHGWRLAAEPPSYCVGGDYLVRATPQPEVWSAGLVCNEEGGVSALEVRRYEGSSWIRIGEPVPGQGWFPMLYEHDGRIRVEASSTVEWDGHAWNAIEHALPADDMPLEQRLVAAQPGEPVVAVPRALGCSDAFRVGERVWCFGEAQIFVNDGPAWQPTLKDAFGTKQSAKSWGTLPPALWAGADTRSAWGSDPGHVFRIRESARQVEHFDGDAWRVLFEGETNGVDGFAADDVWIATASGLAHYDGHTVTGIPLPPDVEEPSVRLVHAVGPGTALAVFDDGKLYRYDGEWSLLFASTEDHHWWIDSVVSTSPNDLWLVRVRASRPYVVEIHRYDGSAWSKVFDTVGYGKLAVRDGDVWLATEGQIVRLPDADAILPEPPLPLVQFASFWFGPDAVWVTTANQAMRYPLP